MKLLLFALLAAAALGQPADAIRICNAYGQVQTLTAQQKANEEADGNRFCEYDSECPDYAPECTLLNPRGRFIAGYKCQGMTVYGHCQPASQKCDNGVSTGWGSCGMCNAGFYKAAGKCVAKSKNCKSNFKVVKPVADSRTENDWTCASCPAGTFIDSGNGVHTFTACTQYGGTCKDGETMKNQAGRTKQNMCEKCDATFELKAGLCVDDMKGACKNGYLSKEPTAKKNECAACEQGYKLNDNTKTCDFIVTTTIPPVCEIGEGYRLNEVSNTCDAVPVLLSLTGQWVHVGSNFKEKQTVSVTVTSMSQKEVADVVDKALDTSAEASSGTTFAIKVANHNTRTDGTGSTTGFEECNTAAKTEETRTMGSLTLEVKASGSYGPVDLEATATAHVERENTDTTETGSSKCKSGDQSIDSSASTGEEKAKESAKNKAWIKQRQTSLKNTLGTVLAEMKEDSTTKTVEFEVTCGGTDATAKAGQGTQNVYVWEVTAVIIKGGVTSTTNIPSKTFLCVGSANLPPKCPRSACGDFYCQCCNDNSWAPGFFKAGIDMCTCNEDNDNGILDLSGAIDGHETCAAAVAAGFCATSTQVKDLCSCRCAKYAGTTDAPKKIGTTDAPPKNKTTTMRALPKAALADLVKARADAQAAVDAAGCSAKGPDDAQCLDLNFALFKASQAVPSTEAAPAATANTTTKQAGSDDSGAGHTGGATNAVCAAVLFAAALVCV